PEGEVEGSFTDSRQEYEFRPELDTGVAYVKIRPGMKVEELENLLDYEPDGVVLEGTGLGHAPVNAFDGKTQHHDEILDRLEELAGESVVAMASQCINGRVNMNVYDAGLKIQEAGVIGAEDMHPELAYVKMMWALGQAENREEAEELFLENVAGEISERSLYGE
ncbi:MAG: hypothetical protein ABEJ66_01625, partial [Candidatus Nanohaloarchaea archaeon]